MNSNGKGMQIPATAKEALAKGNNGILLYMLFGGLNK
jgi:hypothetical protein